MKQRYNTGAPWEAQYGYSRAVRTGDVVEVSGTVSVRDGFVYGNGDAYLQTRNILQIIELTLVELGASLADVIRTRIYVVDIDSHGPLVGKAHGEVFDEIRPVSTMVQVGKLIAPEYLVEIEATAVITDP